MTYTINKASRQWASRPADERFWSIQDAIDSCLLARQAESQVIDIPAGSFEVQADENENLVLVSPDGEFPMGNNAYQQLARSVQAPPGYLDRLPAHVTADLLNFHLGENEGKDKRAMVRSGELHSLTSDRYSLVKDVNLFSMIAKLENQGWRTPPCFSSGDDSRARNATEADLHPNSRIKLGDRIAPGGVYVSDRDSFALLTSTHRIPDPSNSRGLALSMMLENSETGNRMLRFTLAAHDEVCGNHILWGVQRHAEVAVKHIEGRNDSGAAWFRATEQFDVSMKMFEADSTRDGFARLVAASGKVMLGESRKEVLETVLSFFKKSGDTHMSKKLVNASLDVAEAYEDRYGNPRSLWAVVSGITQHSQTLGFQDARKDIDSSAATMLQVLGKNALDTSYSPVITIA